MRKKKQENPLGDYIARNKLLVSMWFADYATYRSSSLWYAIRLRVLKRDHGICRSCKIAAATQVHHASYDRITLLGESINRLYSVCEGCHHNAEFDGERKCSLREANFRLGFAKVRALKLKKASKKKPNRIERQAALKERKRAEKAAFMAQPEVIRVQQTLREYRKKLGKNRYNAKLAAFVCKQREKEAKALAKLKAPKTPKPADSPQAEARRGIEREARRKHELRTEPVPWSNGLYDKLRQRTNN